MLLELSLLTPNQRLADSVYDALRDAIVNGRIPPGAPLRVPELAQLLKVSRSPVREAVQQLAAVGLALDTPRRGVVVAQLTLNDLLDVHDMREPLEALAARRAAERVKEEEIGLLQKILERQARGVKRGSAEQYAATNQEFHACLARISRNKQLQRMQKLLYDQARLVVNFAAINPAHATLGLSEHRAILHAIESRDPIAASAAMLAHMQRTRPDNKPADETSLAKKSSKIEIMEDIDVNVAHEEAGANGNRRSNTRFRRAGGTSGRVSR